MDGDLPEPEAGVVSGGDAMEVAVEFEKDVLGDLFGESAVAGHAQGQGKDHGLVLVDEGLEVGLPAGGRLGKAGGRSGGLAGGGGAPG